jgi:hypothetical protein
MTAEDGSRKPTEAKRTQIAVRLPVALVERIQAHAERLQGQIPGFFFTRAQAMRMLLYAALEEAEKGAGAGARVAEATAPP